MLGLNPFAELLLRFYINNQRQAKSPPWDTQRKVIAKSILKQFVFNHALPTAEDLVSRIERVLVIVGDLPMFCKIIEATLIRYRSHEDRLRYFDFLLRRSTNSKKAIAKRDGRKNMSKIEVESIGDVLDQMLEANAKGYEVKYLKLFNPSLKLSDVKLRVGKFHKQFQMTTLFADQFYSDLADGHSKVEEVRDFRDGLLVLSNQLVSALETNTKDQSLVDCFLFLTRQLLVKQFGTSLADKNLPDINRLMGCHKGMSTENLKRVVSSASKMVKQDKRLNSLYENLV